MLREMWAASATYFSTRRSNMEPVLSNIIDAFSPRDDDPLVPKLRVMMLYYKEIGIEMDSMNKTFATEKDLNEITSLTPHHLIFKKMEKLMGYLVDDLHVQDITGFKTTVPSVFTGRELIKRLMKKFDIEDKAEALHLANMLVSYGYIFCIYKDYPKVKDDGTYYRLQYSYYWPSNIFVTKDSDYVTYLQKKKLKRLWIADYEAKSLINIKKSMSKDAWKMYTERAKLRHEQYKRNVTPMYRKILESQERAFWVLHRPNPKFGAISSKDFDDRKSRQYHEYAVTTIPDELLGSLARDTVTRDIHQMNAEELEEEIVIMKTKLEKHRMKLPIIMESYMIYFEDHQEEDHFFKSTH